MHSQAFPDTVRRNFTNVRQLRDRIPVVDKFTAAMRWGGARIVQALAAGKSIAIRRHERSDRGSSSSSVRLSDTRTTGGSADGDEFQAITTAEYFSDGTRLCGVVA